MINEDNIKNDVKRATSVLKLSITCALFLLISKLVAGFYTQSMAIFASMLDSAMDVASSTVNFIAVREAAKPPDEEHTYGHGKIESLASLFQGIFISLSGLWLIYESARRVFIGAELQSLEVGIGVMTVSVCVSLFLAWRIQQVQKQTQSLVLAAEHLHYATDILSNLGVIAALFLVQWTGVIAWDLVLSIAIVFYIFRASAKILKRAIDELLDRSLSPNSKREIEKLIYSHHDAIVGIHEFRSRCVGKKMFLDFHIEIRGEDDFKRAHEMTESLIVRVQAAYPGADVMVHYDPEGAD